ncbi:MAG: cobyrinate a,c-diamide synthase, partial [Pseudomonadota bacterium]|nr:cobyrinate a,c-diamide synthase [Pseudomonadota bacterium]
MTVGLMIAAPRSGSGKTTVTLGLLRALVRRGIKVAAFKCGPDYIDPAFHKIATGRTSLNLDSWAMPESVLDTNFIRGSAGADVVIAEGSMGLFDGVATRGASGDGASADIAARFGLPVVLVIDASGQSQSAGAVALGFRDFHPDVKIIGVILGNVASDRHRLLAARGIERAGLPVLGALPRASVPAIPERHLGLVQAEEIPNVLRVADALADAMERLVDIDAVLAAAQPVRKPAVVPVVAMSPPGKRIALASDVAFSFTYAHMMADWRAAGAQILPFSPLADEAPSPDADSCWLPG